MTIDDALRQLAAAPTHPGLDGLEASVFASVGAGPPPSAAPVRSGLAVMSVAALLGATSILLPVNGARASPAALALFGPSPPLAPSTLLATDR